MSVVAVALIVVDIALSIISAIFHLVPVIGWFVAALMWPLYGLAVLALWLLLVIKAYQHEIYLAAGDRRLWLRSSGGVWSNAVTPTGGIARSCLNLSLATVVQHLLFFFLVVITPIWDYYDTCRLKQNPESGCKLRYYRTLMAWLWIRAYRLPCRLPSVLCLL